MMKNTFVLLFLISLGYCNAQNKTTPACLQELLTGLERSPGNKERVDKLNEIAGVYYAVANEVKHPNAADSIAFFARQALVLSQDLQYAKGIGKSYISLSRAAMRNKQDMMAQDFADKAISVFSKTGDKEGLAEAYNALFEAGGMVNSAKKNLELCEKIFHYYKEAGNIQEQANALISMADWLIELGKTKEGQAKLFESIALNRKIGNRQIQMACSMLAMSYYQLGDTEKAVKYAIACTKLIEEFNDESEDAADMYNYQVSLYDFLDNKPKALDCLKKAREIALKYNNPGLITGIESNMVKAYLNMDRKTEAVAMLHTMEKKYPKLPLVSKKIFVGRWVGSLARIGDLKSAGKYVNDAVALSAASPPLDFIQNLLYPALSNYYRETRNISLAKKYTLLYKELSEKNANKQSLSSAYTMLFKIDSTAHNFESAVANLKLSQQYKDELLNDTKNKQIAELQVRYETEKKDRENLLMKKRSELQKSRIVELNTAKNISVIAVVSLLIIAGLLYYNYRIKQKSNSLLRHQKQEIDQQNSILQTLLHEKEWLLKEIHHRVKNNLQIVMSLLNTQSHYLKDEAATTAIRNSQHRIHSMALIHKKLYQSDNVVAIDMSVYIKELVGYLRKSFDTSGKIHFVTDVDAIELDAGQAVPIGLIINEAVTNSIKYAFPDGRDGRIAISLKPTSANSYVLRIEDDGIGLKPGFDIKKASTLGLRLIKGLSSDLDAKLSVHNESGLSICMEFVYDEKIILLKDIAHEKLTA